MSNKKYRLLKDITSPNLVKAGTESEYSKGWYLFKYSTAHNPFGLGPNFMVTCPEDFPDWFQEVVEPERVEVQVFPIGGTDCKNGMYTYPFFVSERIKEDKFPAIKQAIEAVLNNDAKVYWATIDKLELTERRYTEADIDKARREGFDASRKQNKLSAFYSPFYQTYEDYKKSLNK